MPAPERSPLRVAAVAPNWLGDAVMCLPALRLLAAAPGVSLAVLSRPYTARVFMLQPGIDDLHADAPGGRWRRIHARTRALRASGARLAVVFPPSFSSALPPWLAGVPARVGYRADGRRAWLTDAPAMPSRSTHLARSYVDLAAAALRGAGVEPPRDVPPARLHVSAGEREAVRERLGPFARDGYAVVVPGAAFGPAKSWPEERYRSLCARLSREMHVVLAGSAGDRARCERIASELPGVHTLAGETSLGELFALIEGARFVVANDSGAPHAAAALGVPAIVLFGSTSPAWTAPVGERVRVLQHVVHCNPCFRRTCPTQLECFNGIAVEEVLAAAGEFMRPAPAASAPRNPMPPERPVG
ncbi:MAG TPA: lipopolysaccharide heptosyltransferase II [Candidatus Krumholzibacteria bacterium]